MPAAIDFITPNSPAAKKKIAPGDVLLSINGHEINDVLDYRFYSTERKLRLTLQRGGKEYTVRLRKEEYDDLGLEFADGLMDEQRHCKNKCVFCFIDQLPPGLRETLYFKDDDARLSFLFGNYITLTNLSAREATRIIAMRLSPINVSVHTMDPVLRCKMMKNPNAGESLQYLQKFADAGLELNAQLVLCPGWNDGEALRFSLQELCKLPTLRSVAAVPVGLTKYREGLASLRPFTPQEAAQVIDCFEEFRNGTVEACCSDEFFLLAGREMPGADYYGEFRQIENGVGLWASLRQDFLDLLEEEELGNEEFSCTAVTGTAARPLLQFLVDETAKMRHNMRVNVCCIRNDFFGPAITVAGLLTGQDIITQLRGIDLGQLLILPAVCFNHDGLTLDGMMLGDISAALNIPAVAIKNDAKELLDAITGKNM